MQDHVPGDLEGQKGAARGGGGVWYEACGNLIDRTFQCRFCPSSSVRHNNRQNVQCVFVGSLGKLS